MKAILVTDMPDNCMECDVKFRHIVVLVMMKKEKFGNMPSTELNLIGAH